MDEGKILFDRMPDYTGGGKPAPVAEKHVAKSKKDEVVEPVPIDTSISYGTPPKLLDNIEYHESRGDALALNPENKQASGAYQFMPETVRGLHKMGIEFNPFNKAQARAAADYYLSRVLYPKYGDWDKTLKEYGGFVKADPSEYIAAAKKGVDFSDVFQPGTKIKDIPAGAAPAAKSETPAVDSSEPQAASLGAGATKFAEVPKYADAQDTGEDKDRVTSMLEQVTPGRAAAAMGTAGALYGASRTPDYRQTFVDLAKDVYGVPSEVVESYLRQKYPQPATGEQLARDLAREHMAVQEAARTAASTANAAGASTSAAPVIDEHGTVRWVNARVAPQYAPPKPLTDQIITLTGKAKDAGSGEAILAENAENVRKLKEMGHDVATMPKVGDLPAGNQILVAQGSNARPSPPSGDVWRSGRGTINWRLPSTTNAGPSPRPVPPVAAPAAPTATAAPAVAPSAAATNESYLADLAKRIQKAGGLAEVLSRGAKAGLYGGAAAMSGMDLVHAIQSMNQEGATPENVTQGLEGSGFLTSLFKPRLGLGVAGGSKAYKASQDMFNPEPSVNADRGVYLPANTVTPQNVSKMLSGLGIAAMPYGQVGRVGGALAQVPELTLAAKQWLLDHPELGQQLQKGSQTYGQSRFGLD